MAWVVRVLSGWLFFPSCYTCGWVSCGSILGRRLNLPLHPEFLTLIHNLLVIRETSKQTQLPKRHHLHILLKEPLSLFTEPIRLLKMLQCDEFTRSQAVLFPAVGLRYAIFALRFGIEQLAGYVVLLEPVFPSLPGLLGLRFLLLFRALL